ncbi:MAG: RES family NAD+ phosphorylase [Actinomycetia bacterium]|nr:RES family NAD+ phosphorylase [Actinomycetes bacterium]
MVNRISQPGPKLEGGSHWTWHAISPATADDPDAAAWVRVFHQGHHCPTATFRRRFGPLLRFDHHTGHISRPAECSEGRTIIYLARNLGTALAEVFGDETTATICPNYRVGLVHVEEDCRVQDLTGNGAMAIGALPQLTTGALSRKESQAWARAIHRDEPAGRPIEGIHYRSAHDEGHCLALFERAPNLWEVPRGGHAAKGWALLDIVERVTNLLYERRVRFSEIPSSECDRCKSGV